MNFGRFCVVFGLFLVSYLTELNAQSDGSLPIGEISFIGHKKTKDHVLRQLISQTPGSPATKNSVEKDLQILKNFTSIGDAFYFVDTVDNKVNITYDIQEVNTLIPIVNFGGIKNNVWFQAGFSDINLLGSGNSISASYRNIDRRSSGEAFFQALRVNGSKWGYSASISKWSSREPLYFPGEETVTYKYDNNSIGLTGIYQFDLNRTVEFGGSIFEENYRKQVAEIGIDTPGPETLLQLKYLARIGYAENFIDYTYFSLKGFTWNFLLQQVRTKDESNVFNHFVLQGKYFALPAKDINLGVRFRLGIATNNDTPFAPFVVDSHINLRGVGNRIDRGTAQFVINTEYRQTVIHEKNWGGQFVIFSDFGTWRRAGAPFDVLIEADSIRQFVGAGIRIIYKPIYGAILRIDYGFDLYRADDTGFVIGFGQYF